MAVTHDRWFARSFDRFVVFRADGDGRSSRTSRSGTRVAWSGCADAGPSLGRRRPATTSGGNSLSRKGSGSSSRRVATGTSPVVVPTQFVLDGDEVLAAPRPTQPDLAGDRGEPDGRCCRWPATGRTSRRRGRRSATRTRRSGSRRRTTPRCSSRATRRSSTTRTASWRSCAGSSRALEPGSGAADPSVQLRKLPGIRGLRLAIREVTAKFKYGGNVDVEHRLAVAGRLAERGGPGDAAARAAPVRRGWSSSRRTG